jgi:hypothetical protein
MPAHQRCPFCHGHVPYTPILCSHCGRAVGTEDLIRPKGEVGYEKSIALGVAGVAIIVAILGVVAVLMFRHPTTKVGGINVSLVYLVGLAIVVIAQLRILIIAFGEKVLLGLGCLVVPFFAWYYIATRWKDVKGAFFFQLFGLALAVLGTTAGPLKL